MVSLAVMDLMEGPEKPDLMEAAMAHIGEKIREQQNLEEL
jgi:hypothetical protein